MLDSISKLLKQDKKYQLVYEQNFTTGFSGVFIIETLDGNMLYNFKDENKAHKEFENIIKNRNKVNLNATNNRSI